MLTKEQLDFLHIFGYLKLPGLFKDDVDWLTEEFGQVFKKQGLAHTGQTYTNVDPFIDKTEKLAKLLNDDRIEAIGSAILGSDFNYMNSDGKYYVGDTLWHRDALVQNKYKFIKFAFYLDPVRGDSGALRVIPGSHRLGDAYSRSMGAGTFTNEVRNAAHPYWGVAGSDLPSQVLESNPGDMLIFFHQLFHSSWGGGNDKRMFAISLSERFREEDMNLMHDYMQLPKYVNYSNSESDDFFLSQLTERAKKHLEQGLAYFHSRKAS